MSRQARTARLSLAALAVAITASAGLTACEPPPPDTYVSLGDSYVAGPLIPNQSTSPGGCLRSSKNYPALVRPTIKVTRFVDVSCSGARIPHMFAEQGVTPGPPNPPQLDALDGQTKVVTLGIGGNDMGFSDIVKNCGVTLPWDAGCKGDYVHDGRDEVSEKIAALAAPLDKVIVEMKKRAPRARRWLVSYPTVLPETGNGCYPLVPIKGDDVVYLRAKVKELNAMLRARAAAGGIGFIDIATPSIGHDFCAGGRWVEGLVPLSVAAPVHPNAAGMRGFAAVVAERINATVTS
ncbi:MAG: hypothetical protein JWM47_962 [Acidimicrobiales bacterium]|nr:hypothetical protein [Acidimicrobiales bacterium]